MSCSYLNEPAASANRLSPVFLSAEAYVAVASSSVAGLLLAMIKKKGSDVMHTNICTALLLRCLPASLCERAHTVETARSEVCMHA